MHQRAERAPDIFRERNKKERYELIAANGEVVGTVKVEYDVISHDDIKFDFDANLIEDPSNILRLVRLEIESLDGKIVDIFSLVKADTGKVLIINDYKRNECSRDGVVYIVKPNSLLRLLTILHELGHLEQLFDKETPSAVEMRKLDTMHWQLVEKREFAELGRLERRYSNIDERNAVARSLQWMRKLTRFGIDCMQPLEVDEDIRMVCELVKQESGNEEMIAEAEHILNSDGVTFQEFSHLVLKTHGAYKSVTGNF